MYIHRKEKLIFLAHPRTGSHAVQKALLDIGFDKTNPGSHHKTLYADGVVNGRNRPEWYVFTTVRNHWDTAISWMAKEYQLWGTEQPSWSLKDFKKIIGNHPWVRDGQFWWVHEDVDVIMHYESLEDDLNEILWEFSLPSVKLSMVNVSPKREGRHYSEFYTETTKDYIWTKFGNEISKFGYEFEERKL